MSHELEQTGLPSFRDLDEQEVVDPDILIQVFDDYVLSGAAISGEAVIRILNKAPVQPSHLGFIGESVRRGLEDQKSRGFPQDAAQYEMVGQFISQKLTELHRPSQD